MATTINPLLSVIIPHYNHNNVIKRAIKSAFKQSVSLEVIVVDDCSPVEPDLKGYNVRYYRHNRNRGLSAARNTGIFHARGEWILPLDADDELMSGVLAKMFSAIDVADVIYGNLVWRGSGKQLKPTEVITPNLFYTNNQLFGSSLYRRSFWEKVGGYTEIKEYYEDWMMWYKLAHVGARFKYIDLDVYLYAGEEGGMCWRLGKTRDQNVALVRALFNQWRDENSSSNNILQ